MRRGCQSMLHAYYHITTINGSAPSPMSPMWDEVVVATVWGNQNKYGHKRLPLGHHLLSSTRSRGSKSVGELSVKTKKSYTPRATLSATSLPFRRAIKRFVPVAGRAAAFWEGRVTSFSDCFMIRKRMVTAYLIEGGGGSTIIMLVCFGQYTVPFFLFAKNEP